MINRAMVAVFSAVAIMSASISAGAQAPAVDVVPPSQAGVADPNQGTVTTSNRIGSVQISLKNNETQQITVRPDPKWRRLSDGSERAASWMHMQTGTGPQGGVFNLAGTTTGAFLVTGDFDQTGTYVTGIAVSLPGGQERRFSLTVTRTAAPVPDGLFGASKPARISVDFWAMETQSSSVLPIAVSNPGTEVIQLDAPRLIRVSAVSGDVATPLALPKVPEISADSCKDKIGPKEECSLKLTIPQGISAGRYEIDVVLSGPGGGRSATAVRVDVRMSAIWAGLIVALGALVGYFVAFWRERGRTILDRQITAAEARVAVSSLVTTAKSPLVRRRADELAFAILALQKNIVAGADVTTQLADVAGRYTCLAKADQLLTRAEDEENSKLFEPLAARLRAQLGTEPWTVEAVNKEAARLAAELAALNDLVEKARRLKERGAQLETIEAFPKAGLVAAREELRQAFVPIAPDQSTEGKPAVVDRVRKLKDAADKLEKDLRDLLQSVAQATSSAEQADALTALKKRANEALQANDPIDIDVARSILADLSGISSAPMAEATNEAAPSADFKIPQLVGAGSPWQLDFDPIAAIGPLATPGWLRFFRDLWSVGVNLAVLAGIGLTGIIVLWAPTPAWGTAIDLITAFLAGVGTRLAIGPLSQANR
ncbi:hypothetical protein [Bradyrhizobium yuanmingense]|uniref:hypothetical protein n=1 Tax=Bradyrhizobium yuanmingense TaxID=108015 RepID=UPI0023B89D7F|nr:hypothetical protein [Bradyrhizobium yuanmingense]MDF0495345.1 hypothetical protein [Bradyrhizobium yuanmingense]